DHEIKSTYLSKSSDSNLLFFEEKYDFIVMGAECVSSSSSSRLVRQIISDNRDIKIIILSGIKWPDAKEPLKLADNIYLAGRGDLFSIFELYQKDLLEKYLKKGHRFYCSPQEKQVLNMIIHEMEIDAICKVLKITSK
ncbi:hypothetical protein, partial [Serratia marcescens]|uniref:hypothetical protein n=1 Tax=Serratia marcescens TaxID=615 RepID=UPI001652BDDF